MRKTYGYMLNRIKEEAKTYIDMSYSHWSEYLAEKDVEKSKAHRYFANKYRAAADALFFVAQEEGWKWEEYEAIINETKKKYEV